VCHCGVGSGCRGPSFVRVRRAGLLQDVRGLGRHDHLCWGYDDPAEFRSQARTFLAEGLELGLQVRYLVAGDPPTVLSHLRGVIGLAGALRRGALRVGPVPTVPGTGPRPTAAVRVNGYAVATAEAVAAGFTGLRVIGDVTSLVCGPRRLADAVRFEHLVDQHMVGRPFSALCGYARDQVPPDALMQLACVHPSGNTDVGFRLHAPVRSGFAAALSGELDAPANGLLRAVLRRAAPPPRHGVVALDASDLRSLCPANLTLLAGYAREREARLLLRTGSPGVTRLVRALDLPDVLVGRF
jgi:hypothetical protein